MSIDFVKPTPSQFWEKASADLKKPVNAEGLSWTDAEGGVITPYSYVRPEKGLAVPRRAAPWKLVVESDESLSAEVKAELEDGADFVGLRSSHSDQIDATEFGFQGADGGLDILAGLLQASDAWASGQKVSSIRWVSGMNYLSQVAKFRVARSLVTLVAGAYGQPVPEVWSETNGFEWSVYDAQTNLVRGTLQSMAGVVGGADAVVIRPYDADLRPASRETLRWARNIGSLLRDEAWMDLVSDPLAGSYTVEALSSELADRVWRRFQECETRGGWSSVEGDLAMEALEIQQKRRQAVSSRRQLLVGVNAFQSPPDVKVKADVAVAALRSVGLGRELEVLRAKVLQDGGSRAQLILFGDRKVAMARAEFARGFLGSAGIELDETPVLKNADLATEKASNSALRAVFCSSDADYVALQGRISAGSVLAGPEQQGFDSGVFWIHRGSDVLETLSAITALDSMSDSLSDLIGEPQ